MEKPATPSVALRYPHLDLLEHNPRYATLKWMRRVCLVPQGAPLQALHPGPSLNVE